MVRYVLCSSLFELKFPFLVTEALLNMLKLIKLLLLFTLTWSLSLPVNACFGPKLYLGTPAGEDGELLFHLAAIYVQEKTGVESIRFEFSDGQGAEDLLRQEKVDLAFHPSASESWKTLLQVGNELFLLSGPRPTDNLQFTTVPRSLAKLQTLLTLQELTALRRQIAAGVLPATAVRQLYMLRGWL